MNRGTILLVDDEEALRRAAADWLGVSGFSVAAVSSGEDALEQLRSGTADVLVTDVRMPGMDGLALLDAALSRDATLPVVLLTGHGDVLLAVDAMRRGAHDFLEKPYDADHLVAVLDRAVRQRRASAELERLRGGAGAHALEGRLVGADPAIATLRERVASLADVDVDVLVSGETGTGKEVVARALHDLGSRRDRPFVALNCAALPEAIFESEIFGHERGAFTGAIQKRVGRIEHATGGTVFLDEIESMPLPLQAKLLRVIQERVVEPVGSNRQVAIDVRFVAAAKLDLKAESDEGRFRADLFFRLSTVTLAIPPLRDRPGDVPLLFARFLAEAAERHGRDTPRLGPAVLAALSAAPWPGNVRELRAVAERHVLGLPLGAPVEAFAARKGEPASLPDRLAEFEATLIREALDEAEGNVQAAANALQVPRRTLGEKIARLGLRQGSSFDRTG